MTSKDILDVNSPKDKVGGPYAVVLKNDDDMWAIVALEWDGTPTLGMRWFNSINGFPTSNSHPTWIILPQEIHDGILHSINNIPLKVFVEDFLCGKITGEQLKQQIEKIAKS